ncbi:MAG: hypothetical protein EOO56_04690 [Hymenobacter sp.]|nr:MAG: hypothetical protein EOO56_04690 [Hymenobacter sp.]
MSVTRLKRKHRKNIARANNETRKIKNLLRTPVLKNVDLDELKSRFAQSTPAVEGDEKKKPEPSVKEEGLFDRVAHAASAAADKVKQAASDAVEAVSHNSVVEKATAAASQAVDAVTHTSAFGAVQEAAHNLVEGAKHVLNTDSTPQPEAAQPAPAAEPAKNDEAQVNQTGTEGFDEAEAVTKPVNEDGQEGEHPKPEIHL